MALLKKKTTEKPISSIYNINTTARGLQKTRLYRLKEQCLLQQKLYEGIDLGNGESVGLISYMRTDSTNLSNDALNDIRNFIQAK